MADGKVYVGSRGKNFCILSPARELNLLKIVEFPAAISSTPVAANGVLYVNTLKTLYALEVSPGT